MSQTFLEKIKELRERTGAGMLDCKKYLLQSSDDLDEAFRLLQLAGFKPKAGRISAEGAVFAETLGTEGALVEINCETDFVANTGAFQDFGGMCASMACVTGYTSAEQLLADVDVAAALKAIIASTKENIVIRRVSYFGVGGTT